MAYIITEDKPDTICKGVFMTGLLFETFYLKVVAYILSLNGMNFILLRMSMTLIHMINEHT